MAKVTGPFGGFKARNQIGKTYVFFLWKGINCVRTWLIPNNPNSAAQQTQRGNFNDLVDFWHNASMIADDKTAWERAAGAVKYKPQSGFNRYIGVLRSIFAELGANEQVYGYANASTGHLIFQFDHTGAAPAGGDVYTCVYGTSPTSMPYSTTGAWFGGIWTVGPFNTGFAAGVKMYFQVQWRNVGGQLKGATGIYMETLT
jgi:hypothetical protein